MPELHLSWLDTGLIALYFASVLFVGFRAARHTRANAEDFLLAGRRLTLPFFVATLVSTWYGGILGIGAYSYQFGLSQWVVFGVPYYVFAVVFAIWLAPRVQASRAVSIPDRLELAYGRPAALVGACLTSVAISPAPYMLMMGVLLQILFGLDPISGLILGTVLSTIFVRVGGFHSVTATNYLEFAMMYLGFAVIVPFALEHVGGFGGLQDRLPALHLTWHGGNSPQQLVVWFLLAVWTLVDPGFHQRCEAAQSPQVARKGILVSVGFWFLFDAMTVTTGLCARAALPPLSNPELAYPTLAALVLPDGIRGIFVIGLLATLMSTLVSFAFLAGQTLGRDLLWRWRGGDEVQSTRLGLSLVLGVGGALALLMPSVIGLWYSIGSVTVPGLLLPLVLTYFRPVQPRVALIMLGGGTLLSAGWLTWGVAAGTLAAPAYPLGIEPLFPGLVLSFLLWGLDLLSLERRPPVQG